MPPIPPLHPPRPKVVPSVSQALDRPYDYILLTTKFVPETLRTPTLLAPLLAPAYFAAHPQPTYIFLQNGLHVEREMYEAIVERGKEPRIVSTALWIGTNMFNDNVVEHSHHVRPSLPSLSP